MGCTKVNNMKSILLSTLFMMKLIFAHGNISSQPIIINGPTNIGNENLTYDPPIDLLQNITRAMKRVCYYHVSAHSNMTVDDLIPEDIPPHLCTHIIIASANIVDGTIKPKGDDLKIYKKVTHLKQDNPNLRVMLSLTGGFANLVKNKTLSDIFAYNAQQFLMTNNFDGLDLDWEFPSWPPTIKNHEEKTQFSYLVIQLSNALRLASHPPLLLSIAVPSPRPIVRSSYEIKVLAQNIDFFSLMGYDFRMFQPFFPFTGYNSPLHRRKIERGYFSTLNIESSANFWVENGVSKDKLVVGIPTYGRTWRLLSFLWNKFGAPAVGPGKYGGYISYPESLSFLKSGASRVFDPDSKVPYATLGKEWVSYEDRKSISYKAHWIKDHNFAGVMTWNLNCDDYLGVESGRKFDLHEEIREIMEN